MRQSGELRPEYVALGLLAAGPSHGYELYRRFKETLAGLWRISESQMYATLKRLEQRGLLEPALESKAPGLETPGTTTPGTATPKTLALSASGREAFESWLLTPSAPHPRSLRLEFLTRLYFAGRARAGLGAELLARQRSSIEATLAERASPRLAESGADLAGLASAFSQGQLKAALAWLDEDVEPALPMLSLEKTPAPES